MVTRTRKIPPPSPLYVRAAQSAQVLGISRSTIYREAKRGAFKIHKINGMALLKVSEIEQWIEGRTS